MQLFDKFQTQKWYKKIFIQQKNTIIFMVFFCIIAVLSLLSFILTYSLASKNQKDFAWIAFIISILFCVLNILLVYYAKKWQKDFNKELSVNFYIDAWNNVNKKYQIQLTSINNEQIKLQNNLKLGLLNNKFKPLSVLTNHQLINTNDSVIYYGNWVNFLDYDATKQINLEAFFYQYLFGFTLDYPINFYLLKKGYKTNDLELEGYIKFTYENYYLYTKNQNDINTIIYRINWEIVNEFFSIYDAKIALIKNHFYIIFLTPLTFLEFQWNRKEDLESNLKRFQMQQQLTLLLFERLISFKNVWKQK